MATNKSLSHGLCIFILLGIFISSAIFLTPVSAATITVTNTNDSGAGSLRQAILDATPGSTIVFDSSLSGGTITNVVELEITKDLVIDGSSLASPITIDGDSSQVFIINAEVIVTLDSLIIQHGYDDGYGGGISTGFDSDLTVANCTLSNNNAYMGGGAIYNGGTLTVTNSTFSVNSAERGGAIYNYRECSVSIFNSTFSGNHGGEGGAIYNFLYSDLAITNSTFVDNYATNDGGGLFNYQLGTNTVTNTSFSNNYADQGGGIFNDSNGANTTISNSTFFGNSADISGGALYNEWSLSLTNCTVSGNSANIYGGGIYSNGLDNDLTVLNSTFSNNTADKGDGIYNGSTGTFNYINTIVANFSDGEDCVNDGTIGTNLNNFVGDHSCGSTFYGDPMIGSLADNGGPTQTHALLEGSPALDVGDSELCPATDQRGVTRPQGTGCDIGAYEYQVNVYVFLPLIRK